jgi:hypothetical protein
MLTKNSSANLSLSSTNNTNKNRRRLLRGLVAGLVLGAATGGCGLIDIPITLQTQSYKANFGNASGTVTAVPCTMMTDPCTAAANQVAASAAQSGATITGRCDTATSTCTAQVDATVAYPVNLAQDAGFNDGVAGKVVTVVKSISLGYGIPMNSVTIDIPQLDLYIAPQGVTKIPDSRAIFVDKIPAIARRQTRPEGSGTITIDTNSPAGAIFVDSIKNPSKPFTLLVNTKPTVKANDPLPAGQITITVTPKIIVGF